MIARSTMTAVASESDVSHGSIFGDDVRDAKEQYCRFVGVVNPLNHANVILVLAIIPELTDF